MNQIFLYTLALLFIQTNNVNASPKNSFKKILESGIEHSASGSYEKAVNYFKDAIAINPKNADGYFQLGFALQRLNKYRESLNAYQTGFKLNPNYYYSAEAYYNMTTLSDNLGEGAKATNFLKKSLQFYTDRLDYDAVYRVGIYLKRLSEKYPDIGKKK